MIEPPQPKTLAYDTFLLILLVLYIEKEQIEKIFKDFEMIFEVIDRITKSLIEQKIKLNEKFGSVLIHQYLAAAAVVVQVL